MIMDTGKIVLGAMIGMAAGAVLGVLFAPDKGSNTRKNLSKQGSRYIGTLKNTANEYVDTLEESIEIARERVTGVADNVRGALEALAGDEPRHHERRA
jgi:gas vesicle protein